MTQPLERAELTAWLTRVAQSIDHRLRGLARDEALALLRVALVGATASVPVLAQLALLDDCLRVAHQAIEADGEIDPAKLVRVRELVQVAAPKYFAVLPRYESFGDDALAADEIERFLVVHRADAGAFGYASEAPWRGLALARIVERHERDAAPLRELERMLVQIMDAVFGGRALASATEWQRSVVEEDARRELRARFVSDGVVGDPRDLAFCRPDAPEVFASVAHGAQVHERDPFDVASIHAEAREVFHRELMRATTPEQHQYGHGRTLLILGDSGAGKTHLLRALRQQVHGERHGYVGYLQLSSEVSDYARYVLRNVIDSLERPYDPPAFAESGLLYLSDGLAEGRGNLGAEPLARLRDAELAPDALASLVGSMVDQVLRTDGLGELEPELIQALLLLQRRDPALQRRVIRFLRCEPLTAHEQALLGGLAPRTETDDPLRTLKQLAKIAYELQLASLVLLVDQIEDVVPEASTVVRLQQAIDVLRSIADAVPSVVVVMACLDDVYSAVRDRLSRSAIDRLEREPPPVRLASQRQRDEVEAMLARRLDHLYGAFGVAVQDDEPHYPFRDDQLAAVTQLRARDAIAAFRAFHDACVAAGAIVGAVAAKVADAPAPRSADLDRAWNDALTEPADLPGDDAGVLALVAEALRGASDELALGLAIAIAEGRLVVDAPMIAPRIVELCNSSAQGGRLGHQLDRLRAVVENGAVPVALRNSDFQFKPKSKIARQIEAFVETGGRVVVLEDRQLRAVLAARRLAVAHGEAFTTWRRAHRPSAHLSFVRDILELDHAGRYPSVTATLRLPQVNRPPGPMVTPPPKR